MGANTAKKRLNVSNTKIAINTMHLLQILIDLKTCQAFPRFKMAIFYFIFFNTFFLWVSFFSFLCCCCCFLAEIQKGKFILTLVNRKNSWNTTEMKLNINLTCHVYREKNAKNAAFSLFICTWFQLSARSCPNIPVFFPWKRKLLFRNK